MVSFRAGTLIAKFLRGQKTEEDLEEFIRQTRDPAAILFAMRINFRYIYTETTMYRNGTVVNRSVEDFFAVVVQLGQNIAHIINNDADDVEGLVFQAVQEYIQNHHVMVNDAELLAHQIATLYLIQMLQ